MINCIVWDDIVNTETVQSWHFKTVQDFVYRFPYKCEAWQFS